MSNHPNRKQGPCRNPKPAEIRELRELHGLTQTQAADLVCASLNAWQQWEAGERRMHGAFWKLFRYEVEAQGK